MNHFIIKLITGEVVYGKLSENSIEKKMLIIHDPLVWEEYTNEDGYRGASLVKFCTGSDENEVPIINSAVISMNRMSATFAKFYDAAVVTQMFTETQYQVKLKQMTNRMHNYINDYYAYNHSKDTGDIVMYPTLPDTEDTIH